MSKTADWTTQKQQIVREVPNIIEILAKISNDQPFGVELEDWSRHDHDDVWPRLDALLGILETVGSTPQLKASYPDLDFDLRYMVDEPSFLLPDEYTRRIRTILKTLQEDGWKELDEPVSDVQDDEEDSEEDVDEGHDGDGEQPGPRILPANDKTRRLPPPDHDIYGTNGIMHGLAIKGRSSDCFNPRLTPVDAKRFGHNGLQVGAWFPRRMAALFHGAHGHSEAGISGDADEGAFALVVSGKRYANINNDQGTTLFYTGPNVDKVMEKESGLTLALHKSMETQKPVRVLRAHLPKTAWSPKKGLRYDGLYRVANVQETANGIKRKYELFELQRLPVASDGSDQVNPVSLESLRGLRPTPEEERDYKLIRKVNPVDWELAEEQ